jgi:glycosyltransferase involved in cell wall biosynthesis
MPLLPISAVVPTRNRERPLACMLKSLASQSYQPTEILVVDASSTRDSERLCKKTGVEGLSSRIVYEKAFETGAAIQRHQAIANASQDHILFLDDDIVFESDCIIRLWQALQSDTQIGGVNAMITNQRYLPPGRLSRSLFRILNGRPESSYAGKCIGPAYNILPEDDAELPEITSVEWLNTTCTLYRRNALPVPLFAKHFTGYSLMEDLALSLTVAKKWKLANARTARIFHDSQPADYKSDQSELAEMELVNRHFVMTRILSRNQTRDYAKLALLEAFGIVTPLVSASAWRALPSVVAGKLRGIRAIAQRRGRDSVIADNGNHFMSA